MAVSGVIEHIELDKGLDMVHKAGVGGKQDRPWNADKPSAALDPYIPIWLTTSPANQRPANVWIFFFEHWKEIVKSVALSGWTGQSGAAANVGDRTYRQIWGPNVNNNIYILTPEYSSTEFE